MLHQRNGKLTMNRPSIACQNCAKLKVTCDKRTPCQQCVRRHIACEPRVSQRGQAPPRNARNASKHHVEGLDSLEEDNESYGPNHESTFTTTQSGAYSNTFEHPSQEAYLNTPASLLQPLTGYSDVGGNAYVSTVSGDMSLNSGEERSRTWGFEDESLAADASILTGVTDATFTSPPTSSGGWPMASESTTSPFERMQKRRRSESRHLQSVGLHAPRLVDISSEMSMEEGSEKFWSSFRCNPVESGSTSINHLRHTLEGLSFQDTEAIGNIRGSQSELARCRISVEEVSTGTRDRLLALTYCFSEKARKLHRVAPLYAGTPSPTYQLPRDEDPVVTLPPSETLEKFLAAYALRFEPSYPSIAGRILSPDKIMIDSPRLGALHLLLMVALGSLGTRTSSKSNISAALTETCRVRLNELLEKCQTFQPPTMMTFVRSALLFTVLAGWR